MFLSFDHQKLDIYKVCRSIVTISYEITKCFPVEERFGLTSQIRRAALSSLLNLAEGCSRRSEKERIRFFEISRGSLIELDAAFDIAMELKIVEVTDLQPLEPLAQRAIRMLSKMIKPVSASRSA